MNTITKDVFLIDKVKHKEKAEWIRRIIRSQIGVFKISVDTSTMLMTVEYDPDAISPSTMQTLIRSVGCDLIIDKVEIHQILQQKRKFRRNIYFFAVATVVFLLSFISGNIYIEIAGGLIFVLFLSLMVKKQRKLFTYLPLL